jgi:hypothetical protein
MDRLNRESRESNELCERVDRREMKYWGRCFCNCTSKKTSRFVVREPSEEPRVEEPLLASLKEES